MESRHTVVALVVAREENVMPWWFNVDTGEVEADHVRSRDANVMGPYDTEEAAARALETARSNTERWDDEDRAWEAGRDTGED
ncbi:MAG: methionine aminopeptidase [Dermatophilaceae bacterium]